jgi:RNA polymerase sigma factor FliA
MDAIITGNPVYGQQVGECVHEVLPSEDRDQNELVIEGKTRDELVAEYAPRISAMARRLMGRLPRGASVDLDDLINSGALGLLDSMNRFDPKRQLKFSTFADFRIRGAMLDVLRRLDPVSRQTRSNSRRLKQAVSTLEQATGCAPEPAEVADLLGLDLEQYWQLVDESKAVLMLSFHAPRGEEGLPLCEMLSDPMAADAEDAVVMRRMLDAVRAAIENKLTERQRTVMVLYYQRNLTLKEIGAVLGVTESRVSQIHSEICLRLRAALGESGTVPARRRAKRSRR